MHVYKLISIIMFLPAYKFGYNQNSLYQPAYNKHKYY